MIDWTSVRTLTFDCYGTIIDWEHGIADALLPVFAAHDVAVSREESLARFAAHEHAAEAPGRRYRDVLATVLRAIGDDFGFTPTDAECAAFGASVGDWPPFADSAAALRRLATRFELVILSNVDDDLFAASAAHLDGVEFSHVVTAQQVGSYKPDPAHFRVGLDRIGRPQHEIVHVAQSLFHDHVPAKALGFTTVWINRRGDDGGSGATPPASATPDLVLADLASLADVAVEASDT